MIGRVINAAFLLEATALNPVLVARGIFSEKQDVKCDKNDVDKYKKHVIFDDPKSKIPKVPLRIASSRLFANTFCPWKRCFITLLLRAA